MSKFVDVRPDQFNPNALEIDVAGALAFSVSFDDAEKLADELKGYVLRIRAERRLQQLLDEGRELR